MHLSFALLSVFTYIYLLGISNAMNSALWVFVGSQLFRILNKEFNRYFLFSTVAFLSILLFILFTYWGIPKLNMSLLQYSGKIINILWAILLFLLFSFIFKILTDDLSKNTFTVAWGMETMMLFILHPYTNNISHIVVEKFSFGEWPLKLIFSLALLHILLIIKQRYNDKWIFKYV